MALPIPNLAARTGWVLNAMPPTLYNREVEPVYIVQGSDGIQGLSG
jgi:hypothetical protein